MMNKLHTYLANYLQTLRTLQAQHSDSQAFLDAAEEEWGDNDPRYRILLEKPQVRWKHESNEPPQEPHYDEDETNLLVDWLPPYLEIAQDLLTQAPDDNSLLAKIKDKWGSQSYAYLIFKNLI
jgi:hypothetical protein